MHETVVAIQLAKQAGEILRDNWGRQNLRIEQKGVINPVSEIDRQSEAVITSGLRKAFPNDSLLAEEGTAINQGVASRWIIDPLDGTTNYLHCYPQVAVSIGLEKNGKMILGVVLNPILDELFVAEAGNGATLNGKTIHVSTITQLRKAVLASGFPYNAWTAKENNTREWSMFVRRCISMRCDGSAALDMCHVACGRVDGYWERGVSPWDVAAGVVIAREAGAWVCNYSGGLDILEKDEIIVSNPILASQIQKILKG